MGDKYSQNTLPPPPQLIGDAQCTANVAIDAMDEMSSSSDDGLCRQTTGTTAADAGSMKSVHAGNGRKGMMETSSCSESDSNDDVYSPVAGKTVSNVTLNGIGSIVV